MIKDRKSGSRDRYRIPERAAHCQLLIVFVTKRLPTPGYPSACGTSTATVIHQGNLINIVLLELDGYANTVEVYSYQTDRQNAR